MNATVRAIVPAPQEDGVTHGGEVLLIGAHRIQPYPDQPRRIFDDASVAELSESIKLHGQRTPIEVRRVPGNPDRPFMLVAGERRWRAAQLIGPKHPLRAVISLITNDSDHFKHSVLENLQREDLAPIDTARALERLIRREGMTIQGAADMFGKSVTYVQNYLLIVEKLAPEIHQFLDPRQPKERQMPLSAAFDLARIPYPDLQVKLAQEIVAEGMTINDARAHITRVAERKGVDLSLLRRDRVPADDWKLVAAFAGRTVSALERLGDIDYEDVFYSRATSDEDKKWLLREFDRIRIRLDRIAEKVKKA